MGSWQLERATYRGDDALFTRNVTDDFRGDRITFDPDYTAYYETGTGRRFTGYWRISALRDRDDDLEFTIDADFFDPFGNPDFRWLGTIDRLTENNFNIRIYERGGLLRLKWDRL
nr:lipocalin family protein [Lewinella sp. JB7]